MNFLFDSFFEKLKFFRVHFGNFCRCQSGTTLRKLGAKKVPQIKIAVLIRYLTHKRRYKRGIAFIIFCTREGFNGSQVAQPLSQLCLQSCTRLPLCSLLNICKYKKKRTDFFNPSFFSLRMFFAHT